MAETRYQPITLVQFAKGWPDSDAGWRMSPSLIPEVDSEFLGSTIAGAIITELLGAHAPPGTLGNKVIDRRQAQLDFGVAVRLLCEDPAGTITGVINRKDKKFTAYWWGTVVGRERDVNGGDDTQPVFGQLRAIRWICEEVKGQLARSRPTCSIVGTTRINRVLPFNESIGGTMGTAQTVDGQSVPTFDLSGAGSPWTYRGAIDYLLATHGRPQSAGLGGPTGGLRWSVDWAGSPWIGADVAWLPYLDPFDADVLALIDKIAPTERGLSWTYRVVGDRALISFISLTPTAITYGGVGVAANAPTDLDLRQTRFAENVIYQGDATGYDYIVVQGDRPLRHVSFNFPGDLEPEASWTTSTVPDDFNDPQGLSKSWRVYAIKPTWDPSSGPGGSTDPFLRSKLSSTADGLPDGTRSHGTPIPPLDALELTTGLGIEGVDGGEQGPILVRNPTGTNTASVVTSMQVTVSNWPPRIIIGSNPKDSGTIKDWWDIYATAFVVTIGVREWEPLQIAWMRPRQDWPGTTPRVLTLRVPDATEVSRSNGCTTGVDPSGNRIGAGTGSTTFRNNLDTLKLQLALLRARFEVEGGTVTWTQRYLHDITPTGSTALGAMKGNLLTPEGFEVCNAVISGRNRDHRGRRTNYTTIRPSLLLSDE